MVETILLLVPMSLLLGACEFKGVEPTTGPWIPVNGAARPAEIAGRDACSDRVEEGQALFGDLHVHTSVSMDANSLGTRTSPVWNAP